MDVRAALKVLEENGSEQVRKTYGRHGVRGAMFGVNFAVLSKLAKQIGTDHDVACALWNSGIHEARLLATMTAEPARLSSKELDTWVRALDNYVVAEAFARLVSNTPHAVVKADEWINSKEEWIAAAGWNLVCSQVVGDGGVAPELTRAETDLPRLLLRIEREIHAAPNRTRYAMNSALIGIGMRSNALERQAVEAAKRVGPVHVDHGLTGCKTPDAASYIPKARKYTAARQAKLPKRLPPAVVVPATPKSKAAIRQPEKPRPGDSTKRIATKKATTRR